MSEPLSSHEIEDVLSSIRRLVSEDLRPSQRPALQPSGAPAVAQPAPSVGKLMLTPSLRIVPDVAVPDPQAGGVDDDAREDGQFAAVEEAPMMLDAGYADDGLGQGEAGAVEVLVGAVADDGADGLGERLAAADAAADAWAHPFAVPDLIEEDPELAAADALPPLRRHWSAETLPDVDWVQAEADWHDDEPAAFVPQARRAELTEDPLARAWAERAEAEVVATLHAGPTTRATTPPPSAQPAAGPAASDAAGVGLFDAEDAMIDEEALRDIVRDIIREELAGTLGERITRNVRKLVRVEINRALTAREFE